MTTDQSNKLHQAFRDFVRTIEFVDLDGHTKFGGGKVVVDMVKAREDARRDLGMLIKRAIRVMP